ncbi:MAG: type IV pilin [Methanobacteriota archaeon]|nr:MAG: type IV pilin [Euryarchaeota archaeon]
MRRKDERGVSPVIATILMVAITVVLAAVLYVMVTNLIGDPGGKKPIVTLRNLDCVPGACRADVTGAQPPTNLAQFKVTVFTDGQRTIQPTVLAADQDMTGGPLTLRFTDIGGEGKLTAGDAFRLSGTSAGHTYEIDLLWSDGTVIQSVSIAS